MQGNLMMGYNDKESNSHLQAVSAPFWDLHHSRSLCFWLHHFASATIQLFAHLSLQLRSVSDLPLGGKACVPHIKGKVTQGDQITWSVKTKHKQYLETGFKFIQSFPLCLIQPSFSEFIQYLVADAARRCAQRWKCCARVCARSSALRQLDLCAHAAHTPCSPSPVIIMLPPALMWSNFDLARSDHVTSLPVLLGCTEGRKAAMEADRVKKDEFEKVNTHTPPHFIKSVQL